MNTKRIEGMGVTAVNDFLLNSEVLVPHVDFNDRTESWDGHIFVYKSINNKKDNIEGRIPVQVKASIVKTFRGLEKSISMDVADLRNYFNDGGVIIFAVECCGTDRKLYYVSLLPYDLNILIRTLKPKQVQKNIKLRHIASSEILEFECICREFFIHKKRQYSLVNFDFPYDKVNEILMEGLIHKDDIFESVLLSQPHYLYGKASLGSEQYEYVTKAGINKLEKRVVKSIHVGEKEYYSYYRVLQTKDATDLIFGKNIRFALDGNTFEGKAKFQGTLLERIHDSNFYLDFIKRKSINISGVGFINIGTVDEDLEEKIRVYNQGLKDIQALLSIFKLNPDDLDLDRLSENEIKTLYILIESMVFNRDVKPEIFKKLPGKYSLKIGSLKVLAYVSINERSKIIIQNFFDFKVAIKIDQKLIPISPYVLLDSNDIVNSANVRLDDLICDIINYEHSPGYDELVNNLALHLITAYDKTANNEYLKCANGLLIWLEGSIDDIIINLNKLQIIKRERKMTEHERKYLLSIIEKSGKDYFISCGIYILLDDINKYEVCFEKLTTDEQKYFESLPIYSLL